MSWQNQYNLNHSTVPKSTCTLLPDLEAIEQVMVEKKGANLKAKGKGRIPKKSASKLKKLELNCTNLILNSKKTRSGRTKTPDPSVSSGLCQK